MAVSSLVAASGGVTQKVDVFTSTGTFTAPSNCSSVQIFLVGAGGGGGWSQSGTSNNTGTVAGGGGGGQVIQRTIAVTPGQSYTVTIGAAGSGATSLVNGGDGGDSSFGSLATALGGAGGGSVNSSTRTFPNKAKAGGGGLGGYIGINNWGNGGFAGGAGGNGVGYRINTGSGNPELLIDINPGTVSYAGSPASGGGNPAPAFAGVGIDNYGNGGSGGVAVKSTDVDNFSRYGPLSFASVQVAGNTATGPSASANTGNGGGGAATMSNGTNLSANGGAGGSGYCRVTYWS